MKQVITELAAEARALCSAIEDLPASEQQTKISIAAAAISQELHALAAAFGAEDYVLPKKPWSRSSVPRSGQDAQ